MDSDPVRIPLATDLKTSISDTTKDARLFNAHTEARSGVERVKKRPGAITTNYNFETPIQGALGVNGGLILAYGDNLELSPVFWSPLNNYLLGDLAWHNGALWEAQLDNRGNVPAEGSTYWVWTFVGGSCGYDPNAVYDIGDGVCQVDPTTGRLARYTARSVISGSIPPSVTGWKQHLWARGNPPGMRYWVSPNSYTIASSTRAAAAAFISTGGNGTYPSSFVDSYGRNAVSSVTDTDLTPNAFQVLTVFEPAYSWPGGSATSTIYIAVDPYTL